MRVLRWIARHWYVPAMIIVSVAAFLLGSRRSPKEAIANEMAAIDAGEKTRILTIKHGTNVANMAADVKYNEKLRKLNYDQAERDLALRADPAARVRFLHRLLDESS